MQKFRQCVSILLFIVSFICVVNTVVEVVMGKYGIVSVEFLATAIFHPLTSIIASFMLVKSRPKQEVKEKEGTA